MRNFDDANYILNATDLGRKYTLTQNSTWAQGLSARQSSIQVPGRHGTVYAGKTLFDTDPMQFELVIKSSTAEGLDAERNALYQLASSPTLKLTRVNGTNTATADVVIKSLAPANGFIAKKRATFLLTLLAPSGVFLGREVTRIYTVPSGSAGTAGPMTTTSSAPVMNMTLEATGPLSHLEVRDFHTGAWLRLPNAAVTTTAKVVIHTGALTATVGGVDVSAKLERHPQFLGMAVVNNTVLPQIYRTGTGSTSVTAKFNHTFF